MDSVRRIRTEDYPEDSREVIAALAPILNSFMEQVVNIFDGNVDYDNIRRNLVIVDVETVSGVPTSLTRVKYDVKGKVVGTDCIQAINQSQTTDFPTAQPFVSFTTESNLLTLRHISGLQDNIKYRLYIEIIAE